MKLIDRIFLFSLIALSAWAQQAPPESVAAESALRARAEQFFQLQVEKKYRQAESLVANESKDDYYNGSKYSIKSFSIDKIELLDNNTRARVTIKAKVTLVMPAAGAFDVTTPSTSNWKLENGEWVLFVDTAAGVPTPFGTIKPVTEIGAAQPSGQTGKLPDISAARASVMAQLKSSVKVDRDSVVLTHDNALQTVTISNNLPGAVDLELGGDQIPGVTPELEKKHLAAGEQAALRLRATGEKKGTGVVRVFVSPIASELEINVAVN